MGVRCSHLAVLPPQPPVDWQDDYLSWSDIAKLFKQPAYRLIWAGTAQVWQGHLLYTLTPPTAEIITLYVPPNERRQGIAAALMKTLIAEAKKQHVDELIAEVRVSNTAAQALYSKLGAMHVGERADYYLNPVESAALLTFPLAK